MADMVADRQQAPNSTGHFRVVIWFGTWAVAFLFVFLYRLDALRPNWLVLGPLMLLPCLFGLSGFRDLLIMKPGSNNERIAQIAIAVGASLIVSTMAYFSWRYGAPSVMRVMETYVLPAFIPIGFAFAAVALHVERKHKVRVFVGNRGWLYLPLPSNNALLTDASTSPLRAQHGAAKRER